MLDEYEEDDDEEEDQYEDGLMIPTASHHNQSVSGNNSQLCMYHAQITQNSADLTPFKPLVSAGPNQGQLRQSERMHLTTDHQ